MRTDRDGEKTARRRAGVCEPPSFAAWADGSVSLGNHDDGSERWRHDPRLRFSPAIIAENHLEDVCAGWWAWRTRRTVDDAVPADGDARRRRKHFYQCFARHRSARAADQFAWVVANSPAITGV